MRITSGVFRGRILVSPQSTATHPMGDRVRLALFNSLRAWWQENEGAADESGAPTGLCVLDTYAGTGALGLEALSRGATHVDFVEKDRHALAALRQNLTALSVPPSQAVISQSDVAKYHQLPPHSAGYNLIFIDPPYDHFHPAEFSHLAQLLAPGGRLVLSHPSTFSSEDFTGLRLLSTRHYAAAHISLLTK